VDDTPVRDSYITVLNEVEPSPLHDTTWRRKHENNLQTHFHETNAFETQINDTLFATVDPVDKEVKNKNVNVKKPSIETVESEVANTFDAKNTDYSAFLNKEMNWVLQQERLLSRQRKLRRDINVTPATYQMLK
jgi:hypothetical protein